MNQASRPAHLEGLTELQAALYDQMLGRLRWPVLTGQVHDRICRCALRHLTYECRSCHTTEVDPPTRTGVERFRRERPGSRGIGPPQLRGPRPGWRGCAHSLQRSGCTDA
jgi:hypothetical protein